MDDYEGEERRQQTDGTVALQLIRQHLRDHDKWERAREKQHDENLKRLDWIIGQNVEIATRVQKIEIADALQAGGARAVGALGKLGWAAIVGIIAVVAAHFWPAARP